MTKKRVQRIVGKRTRNCTNVYKVATRSRLAIESENQELRRIAADLHWMARRYADGRETMAPYLLNKATDFLLSIGVRLKEGDEASATVRLKGKSNVD